MSPTITAFYIRLGCLIAGLLVNLPMRQANLLLILVLLPFCTSFFYAPILLPFIILAM